MCGFLFAQNGDLDLEKFRAALLTMYHRGPDSPGNIAKIGNCLLGHNRLAIFDLSKSADQPFLSRSGRSAIIFNGEIYNYKELAIKHSIPLRTQCDTELLVELYEKLGANCLSELNGMFAFVILNVETLSVFIARDRLGVKPLYYAYVGKDGFIAASEIAPLIDMRGTQHVDEIGLRQYKKLRAFFNGHTLYKDIKMFPAGHYMLDGVLKKYWSLPEGEQEPPSDEELRFLIESAVSYRCLSDVSVGSYLSGGLDSTIVATLAQKPDTWTVGFAECNEFDWSELAAQKIGSRHTCVKVEPEEFIHTAKYLIKKRQEPLSVPNEVLLYLMTKKVKSRNTVVLSGEGADELFFGYDRIFRWAFNAKRFDIKEFDKLYSYSPHEDQEILVSVLAPFMDSKSVINTVARFFQISHLHGLLRRLDNSTMMCGVEAREPFVDYRLVERLAGVSFAYKMKDGVVKAPLKRIFKDMIPDEIILRKKIGFPVPLEKLFSVDNMKDAYSKWLDFNLKTLFEEDNCY